METGLERKNTATLSRKQDTFISAMEGRESKVPQASWEGKHGSLQLPRAWDVVVVRSLLRIKGGRPQGGGVAGND